MKTLTQDQYCPSLRAGWTVQDSIMRQVQIEDFLNHQDEPMPALPKTEIRKEGWGYAAWKAFQFDIKNITRP